MKKTIILASIIAFTVIAVVALNFMYQSGMFEKRNNKEIEITDASFHLTTTKKEKIDIVVEIKGAVKYPGIYHFNYSPVLVYDVIEMAGGLTSVANTDNLNMAAVISNNSCIVVGQSEEDSSYTLNEGETISKININTASLDELISLPGIGEKKAQSIISYRKENGFFKQIEDLKNVEGIGNALFESIKDDICV